MKLISLRFANKPSRVASRYHCLLNVLGTLSRVFKYPVSA